MDQKELYIQYLEDALNHAKTGEPMKKWQWRWKNSTGTHVFWDDVLTSRVLLSIEKVDLRIKPEPFKWTTFVCRDAFGRIRAGTFEGHLTKDEIINRMAIANIYAFHHHEVKLPE